jgi:hypothetical protein
MTAVIGREQSSCLVRFRWIWLSFMVLATSAPYLLDWSYTPAGYHYNWILPSDPEDSLAYMTWAEQAARGAWLFKIKYTALPHHAFLFHPFFLICGWLSAITSWEIGLVFFAVKAIGVAIFFLIFYRYLDYLRVPSVEFVAASVLLGISSGFGGVVAFLGWTNESAAMPADLSIPEVTTYWSLLWNPLVPFSLTLMLLSIYWLDRATSESRVQDCWRAGIATALMALIHPYSLPVVFAFGLVVTLLRQKSTALSYLWRYLAVTIPFVAYEAILSIINPMLVKHSALGQMKSPAPPSYLLGFGFPLLLFIAGLIVERGRFARRYWQVALWFFLCLILTYLPVWFQRKLIFGAQIPLAIIGGVAVNWIWTRCSASARPMLIGATAVLIPLLALTPAYLLIQQNKEVRENIDNAYFEDSKVIEALKALKRVSQRDDVVFAEPSTSRLIPAFSGTTTIWGHWAMSVDYEERRLWLDAFLHSSPEANEETTARQFWRDDIQFIFADKRFKQSLQESPSVWRVVLRHADKVFENESAVIYRRKRGW